MARVMRVDLAPDILLSAYAHGVFPMADPDGEIRWYQPHRRGILPLDQFHVPRTLRQRCRQGVFETRVDADFEGVIRGCIEGRGETWISEEIIEAYCRLHQLGFAHTVESWQEGRLVGGLYGVTLGGAFFGESMFHRATDASKVALVKLVERLREREFTLLDVQFQTPHLARFGVIEIPHEQYLTRLRHAIQLERWFAD